VIAELFGPGDQGTKKRAADALSAPLPRDIHGEVGDEIVGFPWVEMVQAPPAHDRPVQFRHQHGVSRPPRGQPLPPLLRSAFLGLQRGDPIDDPLVVDGGDGCCIAGRGVAGLHGFESHGSSRYWPMRPARMVRSHDPDSSTLRSGCRPGPERRWIRWDPRPPFVSPVLR